MKIIHNIRMSVSSTHEQAIKEALKVLNLPQNTYAFVKRESTDARRVIPSKIYSIAVDSDMEHPKLTEMKSYKYMNGTYKPNIRPYIIGFGPAGMFCALMLARNGIKPIIIERGEDIENRTKKVQNFWNGGTFDPNSNVQFGEGGAGAFSDGKLTTRINDPRCEKVLEEFIHFGSPKELGYLAKPHIGTDILKKVVENIRLELVVLGCEIRFNSTLNDIKIEENAIKMIKINENWHDCDTLILAIGNASRDTFRMLINNSLEIAPKPFSVGFRMEHLQEDINIAMFGKNYDKSIYKQADYSFSKYYSENESVYTFCMCPGGTVVNASSAEKMLVTNGMSSFSRDNKNANSALCTGVGFSKAIEGIEYQEHLERKAYNAANGKAPIMLAKDFINGTMSRTYGQVRPTFQPGTFFYDISTLFSSKTTNLLKKGLNNFKQVVFNDPYAILTGVETRTSSPIRILRNENMQTVGIKGIFPCGEGAGYAGGIMSSAVDGIKVAEQFCLQ